MTLPVEFPHRSCTNVNAFTLQHHRMLRQKNVVMNRRSHDCLPLSTKQKHPIHARSLRTSSSSDINDIRSQTAITASYGEDLPSQVSVITNGGLGASTLVRDSRPPDLDYLQELLAIQNQGPRAIGFFGTRNTGMMHQQLIEILSYAMIITNNHIFTSGASGTNSAVIRGALRAEKPDQLTVILPQSLKLQSAESQELLAKVNNLVEKPQNDDLSLIEASRLCNMDIISHVQQVICFAFHDSRLLLETCDQAKNMRKIVTLFYLD